MTSLKYFNEFLNCLINENHICNNECWYPGPAASVQSRIIRLEKNTPQINKQSERPRSGLRPQAASTTLDHLPCPRRDCVGACRHYTPHIIYTFVPDVTAVATNNLQVVVCLFHLRPSQHPGRPTNVLHYGTGVSNMKLIHILFDVCHWSAHKRNCFGYFSSQLVVVTFT